MPDPMMVLWRCGPHLGGLYLTSWRPWIHSQWLQAVIGLDSRRDLLLFGLSLFVIHERQNSKDFLAISLQSLGYPSTKKPKVCLHELSFLLQVTLIVNASPTVAVSQLYFYKTESKVPWFHLGPNLMNAQGNGTEIMMTRRHVGSGSKRHMERPW